MGSNENSEGNMELCRGLLCEIFDTIYYSETSITTPFGEHYQNDFLNQLALAYTNQELEDVVCNLKLLEKQIGRNSEDKTKGVIKIDIDLIKWNDTVLKEEDWKRSYVADLLPSLHDNTTSL